MAAPVITVAPFIYEDYRQDPRLRGQNTLSLDFFLSKQFDESVKIHINEKPLLTWVIENKWNQDLIPEFNLRKFMALVSHLKLNTLMDTSAGSIEYGLQFTRLSLKTFSLN